MNKSKYYEKVESNLKNVLSASTPDGYRFNNYKGQINAWRLGAKFERTYSENYLWSIALFISTNAVMLLRQDSNNKFAMEALKESAEVYEYLYEASEKYDRGYCVVMSALCYDIAGYQANALCMMRSTKDYLLISSDSNLDVSNDNQILFHIKQILLKQLSHAIVAMNKNKNIYLGLKIFEDAIGKFYRNALFGEDSDYLEAIYDAYDYSLQKGDVHLSHLLFLLTFRIEKYKERSIWLNLKKLGKAENPIWRKYIKLLTTDLYEQFKVKEPQQRISKYEFWISQLRALEKGLLTTDESYVIQMPTSTGKTFIAELAILDTLVKNPNKKCIYIAPFRALTNEIEYELSKNLSKLGYTISSLSGSYEIDEFENFLLDATDVLVATPEKMDFLLRINEEYFSNVALLIVDEGHIIGNIDERASLTEFLIIRLKRKIGDLRTLFISAVMPEINAHEFSEWISTKKDNVVNSKIHDNQEWKPTRNIIGKFSWVGKSGMIDYPGINLEDDKKKKKIRTFVPNIISQRVFNDGKKKAIYPNLSSKSESAAMLAYKFSEWGSCLIFAAQPRYAISIGKALLKLIELIAKQGEEVEKYFKRDSSSESFYWSKKWYGQSIITDCLEYGIGIHFGTMAEPVRRAIESDYRAGRLSILISTHTVGQGLNFPIKTLIFHSVVINADPQHYREIKVRDFWNIVGRTGRAGRETEGQVIYLTFNANDNKLFEKFTSKKNLEKAKSIFCLLLEALIDRRISEQTFQKYLEQLSETYLINLLIEEVIDTEFETITAEIIDNSLFKIQVGDKDITPLRDGFKKIFKKIQREVPDSEKRKIYSKTGFSLDSNHKISQFIDENIAALKKCIASDDYIKLITHCIRLFRKADIKEVELRIQGVSEIKENYFVELLGKWINGTDIEEIKAYWESITEENIRDSFDEFIGDAFFYRYPWGITSFLIVLAHKMSVEFENLPTNIKNVASYVKFGVDNDLACLARSLGIKNREVAVRLSGTYKGTRNYRYFMQWLASLSIDDLSAWKLNLFDIKNIIEVALKLNPPKHQLDVSQSYSFKIKGIFFDEQRKKHSRQIKVGNELTYKRDIKNEYDPYAIGVYFNNNMIGYVPREMAKLISTEIDLNDKRFKINVSKVEVKKELSEIEVKMYEAE